jgi:hypothetical protein
MIDWKLPCMVLHPEDWSRLLQMRELQHELAAHRDPPTFRGIPIYVSPFAPTLEEMQLRNRVDELERRRGV